MTGIETRMTISIKAKLEKQGRQMNIYKYGVSGQIELQNIILKY